MTDEEMSAALAAEVQRQVVQMPATGSGTLHFKAEVHRVDWPPDEDAYHGAIFISMPFPGADADRLRQIMQHVREGEIVVEGYRVRVEEDEPLFSHDDAEVGAKLTTLLAQVRMERP